MSEANPLTAAFEKELDKMGMNYSYKPLLLLALFSKESLSAKVEEIIDFYFTYYSGRAEKGQVVEKGDSSFIQNPGDRLAARRTILRYPVSVLAKKCFVVYDKGHDTVSVNSEYRKYLPKETDRYSLDRDGDSSSPKRTVLAGSLIGSIVSRVRSNTYAYSKFLNETELAMQGLREEDMAYKTIRGSKQPKVEDYLLSIDYLTPDQKTFLNSTSGCFARKAYGRA